MLQKLFWIFIAALQFLFITLKLTGHLSWGWFGVLSPILLPSMVAGVVLTLMCLLGGLGYIIDFNEIQKLLKKNNLK